MCIRECKKITFPQGYGWKVFRLINDRIYALWNRASPFKKHVKVKCFNKGCGLDGGSVNFGFFKTLEEAENYKVLYDKEWLNDTTIIKKVLVEDVYEGRSDESFNWHRIYPTMLCCDYITIL